LRDSKSVLPRTRSCRVNGIVLSDGLLNPLLSPENPTFGLCAVPQNAPSAAHQAQRTITPQPALSFAPPIDQTKPIGHGPSSGLALCIFSSPARLRSPLLAAYTWCRRAAKLKILCFRPNGGRNRYLKGSPRGRRPTLYEQESTTHEQYHGDANTQHRQQHAEHQKS